MNGKAIGLLTILAAGLLSATGRAATWAQSLGATSQYNDGTVEDSSAYGPGYDTPAGIGLMPDGGLVVAGQLDLPELGSGNPTGRLAAGTIVRYGADGNIVWQKMLRFGAADSAFEPARIFQIATDAQGNIFLCGSKGGVQTGNGQPFAMKMNSSGAIVWQNGFALPGNDNVGTFTTMGLTADGGVVVGAFRSFFPNFQPHSVPSVTKFNSDGSLGFHAAYDNLQQYNATAAVCQSLSGSQYVMLIQTGGSGVAAVRLNSTGDIASQVVYPYTDGRLEVPIQVIATADGGYATLSSLGDGVGYLRAGLVLRKLNPDLSTQFEKAIRRSNNNGEGLFIPTKLAQTSDGGFLVFGNSPVDYRPFKAALMKLNSTGVLQFVSVLGGSKDEGTNDPAHYGTGAALPTSGGGYAFATQTFSYVAEPSAGHGKPDWWIAVTDANRHVEGFGDVTVDLALNLFSVTDTTRANSAITDYSRMSGYVVTTTTNPSFVLEDLSLNTGRNKPTVLVQGAPLPPPPAHGGLSGVTFFVNDSASPLPTALADTVLRFRALQTGSPGGLKMRVQATTTPGTEASWTDLANDRAGRMTFDYNRNQFFLNSTDYPALNGIYFRALGSAGGYTDSASNVVGPFNLVSVKPRLSPTRLTLTANSSVADMYLRANKSSVQNGEAVRIQSSTNPTDEASWTDLNNGNSGAMTRSTNAAYPNIFLLLFNNPPAAHGIFFRAVASLSGSVDSLSNATGPFTLVNDTPPTVVVQPPSGLPGSGDGHDADHPVVVAAGQMHIVVNAQSNRTIKTLKLLVDGSPLISLSNTTTIDYTTSVIGVGLHILDGFAIDDLGASGRGGTSPIYLKVNPAVTPNQAHRGQTDSPTALQGRSFNAVRDGAWTDPATWDQNAVPDGHDFVTIASHSIQLTGDPFQLFARSLAIYNATLTAQHGTAIDVSGNLTIGDCTLNGPVILSAHTASTDPSLQPVLHLINAQRIQCHPDANQNRPEIFNFGTMIIHGSGGLVGGGDLVNAGTIKFVPAFQLPPNAATDPAAVIRLLNATAITNSGLITGNLSGLITSDGAGLITSDGAGLLTNNGGTIVSRDGAGLIGHDGASLIGHDGASLIGHDGASLLAPDGATLLAPDGATFISDQGSALGGAAQEISTRPEGTAANPGYVQTGGETDLSHVVILGSAAINGGTVTGSGIIVGDVTNNAFISPGHGSGGVSILGNYTQGAQGTLIVENGGAPRGQFDRLDVLKTANLNGKVNVRDINGYTPSTLDTFNPLGFKSATGSFSSVSSNAQITVTGNGVVTSVNPSAPAPKPAQPLNISTRLKVLPGDNVLIGGFIVTGPNGSSKKVLIRGIAPSLANFGVPGTMADPLLELHKPDGSTVVNDNWQQGDTSQIPNGFIPGDPRESVVVATLAPGNYTAVLRGAHGETGVALAEAYDLDPASAAQLANISTRGFVDAGDNVMIGGFIIDGTEPTRMLVRAIGPSLTAFGVQGALPATTLELHDANGGVIGNEGWRSAQEADIIATMIPPSSDDEAAILGTLVPGNYTAVVRGRNNTTGIGLVEAYNLP